MKLAAETQAVVGALLQQLSRTAADHTAAAIAALGAEQRQFLPALQ